MFVLSLKFTGAIRGGEIGVILELMMLVTSFKGYLGNGTAKFVTELRSYQE